MDITYYIASLAKFGNHCSTVWAHRQHQWESNNYNLSFQRIRAKFTRFTTFSNVIFYPAYALQHFQVLKTIPALACLVTLMIWHSCYHAWTFEVCGPKIYESKNKLLPLHVYTLEYTCTVVHVLHNTQIIMYHHSVHTAFVLATHISCSCAAMFRFN